jgi:hypothetical protein
MFYDAKPAGAGVGWIRILDLAARVLIFRTQKSPIRVAMPQDTAFDKHSVGIGDIPVCGGGMSLPRVEQESSKMALPEVGYTLGESYQFGSVRKEFASHYCNTVTQLECGDDRVMSSLQFSSGRASTVTCTDKGIPRECATSLQQSMNNSTTSSRYTVH